MFISFQFLCSIILLFLQKLYLAYFPIRFYSQYHSHSNCFIHPKQKHYSNLNYCYWILQSMYHKILLINDAHFRMIMTLIGRVFHYELEKVEGFLNRIIKCYDLRVRAYQGLWINRSGNYRDSFTLEFY